VPGRVFVAITLPEAARERLTRATEALVAADPPWAGEKIVAADLLHVTLAFIGRVPGAALDDLLAGARAAAAGSPPFDLRLADIRAVPSGRRASMVWATLDGETAEAGRLADAISSAAGLPGLDRPFRAHVTLARARRARPVADAALEAANDALSGGGKDPVGSVSVPFVTVLSSTLGRGGPVYEPLAELRLCAARRGPGND
jgi:2'-5' RNA ligase